MGRCITYIFVVMVIGVCSCSNGRVDDDTTFTDSLLLPATPMRHTDESQAKHIHVMLETIECDRLAMGDSVTLSPLWSIRHMLEEKAMCYVATGEQSINSGTLTDAWDIIKRYGAVTYNSYYSQPFNEIMPASVYSTAERAVMHTAKIARKQKVSRKEAAERIATTLDNVIGPAPLNAFLYGMEYTPQQLAESMALPDEWAAYGSYATLPFYKQADIRIAGNRKAYSFRNVPLDSLLSLVVSSLENGHPVAWEGDRNIYCPISTEKEKFSDRKILTDLFTTHRNALYRTHRLKPKHQLCIIGLARHNVTGETVFIIKTAKRTNNNVSAQYLYSTDYMSLTTFLAGTTAVMAKNREQRIEKGRGRYKKIITVR